MLDPNTPESYLGLLNVNPNSLPESQRKIERALYAGVVALGSASTPTYDVETKLETELFAPLSVASTRADLQATRLVAEKLRNAGQKTLDEEKHAERKLIQELNAAGLAEILAPRITAFILAKTSTRIHIATRNPSRIYHHTLPLNDFL